MAYNNQPIIKRSRQAIWSLIDLIEIYYHSSVRTPSGVATVLSLSKKDNTVTVTNKKNQILTYSAKNIKLMIRPLTQLQGKNLNVIVNLALGIDSFSYSVKRAGNRISCVGKAYTVDVFIKPQFSIRVMDAKNTPVESRNLGFIVAYLTERDYDLFNLLKTSYAMIASGVPNI